jgi:hypothetical protein
MLSVGRLRAAAARSTDTFRAAISRSRSLSSGVQVFFKMVLIKPMIFRILTYRGAVFFP